MTEYDEFARTAIEGARLATLGTVGPDGRPHLVPIVFSLLVTGAIVSAVDHKPKSTRRLRRIRNIEQDPRVTLLVDHYSEDWSALWWVRVDGDAHVSHSAPPGGLQALASKYPQYRGEAPPGPWIIIEPSATRVWTSAGIP